MSEEEIMEFSEVIRKRRSVRHYDTQKAVPREVYPYLFEAVRLSPSAHNSRGWSFYVVDDAERKHELCRRAFSGVFRAAWIDEAPVLVVMTIKKRFTANVIGEGMTGIDYRSLDGGIAGEHFVLAAAEKGLGTCWIGWFDKKKLAKAMGLSRKEEPLALFTLGYPAPQYEPKKITRTPLDEIWRFYGED
jgi:nitroreductase